MQQKGESEFPSVRGFDMLLLPLGCRDPGARTGERLLGVKGCRQVIIGKKMGTSVLQHEHLHCAKNLNCSQSLPRRAHLASNLILTI